MLNGMKVSIATTGPLFGIVAAKNLPCRLQCLVSTACSEFGLYCCPTASFRSGRYSKSAKPKVRDVPGFTKELTQYLLRDKPKAYCLDVPGITPPPDFFYERPQVCGRAQDPGLQVYWNTWAFRQTGSVTFAIPVRVGATMSNSRNGRLNVYHHP